MSNDKLWTINELITFLKLSYPTIWGLIKNGKLPAIRIGTQWRVTQEALDEFIGTKKPNRQKIHGDDGVAIDIESNEK